MWKYIVLLLIILLVSSTMLEGKTYSDMFNVSKDLQICIDKHIRRINVLNSDSYIKEELALQMCIHLEPVERDYAIAIAMAESNIEQINSRSEKDIGIFQIYINEIKRRKLNKLRLETNVEYQVLVFRDILREKLRDCRNRYPFTAIACYHSATPRHHYRYFQKFELYYRKIWRVL